MRKGVSPKRKEIKHKKKFEEAEDHRDEYHEAEMQRII